MKLLTITGVDNLVSPDLLEKLQEKYKFVEWGILFSKTRQGSLRYPTWDYIAELKNYKLNLSAHLCGQHVHEVTANFNRIQLNNKQYSITKQYFINSNRFIIPVSSFQEFQYLHCLPLLDTSGGRGVIRDTWPDPLSGVLCGYAGGISLENIKDVLYKISFKTQNFWIDLETGARTDNKFDFDKVEQILKIGSNYV